MLRTQQFSSQVPVILDARTCMTFDVELLTGQLEQCQKQLDEDPEAETELVPARQGNLTAVS